MKLNELHNHIILEKQFRSISKDLGDHIDKLDDDRKEFKLGIVKTMVKKANEFIDLIEKTLKSSSNIRDIDDAVEKGIKRLNFFKPKFEAYIKLWSDNEFAEDIVKEATEILKDLIEKIDTTVDGAEEEIKKKLKVIAQSATEEANGKKKHGRSVPQGYAIDLKTKKGYVHKEDK